MKRIILGVSALVVVAFALVSVFGNTAKQAHAAAAPPQCNAEMNQSGYGVHCTITIVNYVDAGGGLAGTPPSTMTMTRCAGATGPVFDGSVVCDPPVVTPLTEPVTSVNQCNGSGNGGGGIILCTVSITNHFAEQPGAIVPATVYQCVGSVITGTGAPGSCTPANTPGISSVAEATVGQCNGSGNGGTSVGFTCSVSFGSTMATTFPVNINQCNGSAEGGGALTICEASVTNLVDAPPATATPTSTVAAATATPSSTPAGATPLPSSTPVNATSTPSDTPAVETPFPTSTPAIATPTVGVPQTTPQAQVPPTASPTPTSTVPASTTTVQASPTPQGQIPPSIVPLPPSTGNAGTAGNSGNTSTIWLGGLIIATIGIAGLYGSARSKSNSKT